MSEKRATHSGKITIPVEVEVKFKTVKPEGEEEFVSMTAYDMMSNAYKEAFDECTRLKAKLARIQEVIKDK